MFKAITGGDPIKTDVKHVQTDDSVTLMGQILVIGNAFIKTNDSSNALARRRVSLRFDRKPTPKEKNKWNKEGGEAGIIAEGAGIVNWALELSEEEALNIMDSQTSNRIEDYKLEAEMDDKPLYLSGIS